MAVKRQVVWGVASLATLYVGVANALGLGELTLDSALNQPLNATIVLQGGENVDPNDIRVHLADSAAFRNAGLDRPHFLAELRFTPTIENNQLVVRVQSRGPVREPYLNFLVELRRPNGRLLREYTLLLDPPLYQPSSPAQPSYSRAPVTEPARQNAAVRAAPAGASAPSAPLPQLSPAAGAAQYRTAAGDSLWSIASRARPSEAVSIAETMRAIRALNPDAFIGGDPSRLRVGQVLTLPTAEQLGATGSVSVAAATQDSEQPDEQTEAPLIPPRSVAQSSSSAEADAATGSVTNAGQQDRNNGAEPATARLRIEEENLPQQTGADSAVLADRLRALEARFNVLLDELDARDRQIASLQAELEILRQAQQAEAESADGALSNTSGPTLTQAEGTEGPVSATGSEEPEAGAVDAEVLPVVAEVPEQQLNDAEQLQGVEARDSFLSRWWPALLGLLAVLLGLLFFARKRADERDEAEPDEQVMPAQPTRVAPQAAAPLAAAVASTPRSERPASVRAAPKPVDPLDGVELYITYGRFAEARNMLDKAIADQPDRLDLRYKQLRVLGELGDFRAFGVQEQQVLEKGGDTARIEQIKARFPTLFASNDSDMVEQVDHLEPMLPDEPTSEAQNRAASESAEDFTATQLNLNDFTLDPDWELIEGLTPAPPRKGGADGSLGDVDEGFESSLHEFPQIEELDDEHHEHFPGMRKDDKPRSDDR